MTDTQDLIDQLRKDAHHHIDGQMAGLMDEAADALEAIWAEIEAVRKANIDCVDNFNTLMKDYTDLQKELIEIEEREYKNKLIESR